MLDLALERNKSLAKCADLQAPWPVFLELVRPDVALSAVLPPFNRNKHVFIFFMLYSPAQQRLIFCGSGYYGLDSNFLEMVPDMCARVGFPTDTLLTIYEEHGAACDQPGGNSGASTAGETTLA